MSEVPQHAGQSSWHISKLIKEWKPFLALLLIVSIALAYVGLTYTDTLVIYAQKSKPDFMQVFFPIGGAYSEGNSVRTTLFESPRAGVKIALPRAPIDHVRIDPVNEATEIVITKIEFRYLLGTVTLMPNDLVALVKPIQMIGRLEITPAGLLISSTGNDPAFKLQLIRPSVLSQLIKLSIASLLLSLVMFFASGKLLSEKGHESRAKIYLLAVPLLFALGIAALFYPGFMSYDTIHALRSARNGVTDSMWPPMVSYVWRAVDMVSLNPSAMHFAQVFLLLFSIVFVIYIFTKRLSVATAFLLIYLAFPTVLGTVAVIWKDVLMAAFFLAGFAVIVSMKSVVDRRWFAVLALTAALLIFLGVCARHNAITGAVPLLFYLAFVMCSRVVNLSPRKWIGVILLGSILTGAVFAAKTQLDNYSLPGFEKLSNSNDFFIRAVRVFDVAGASLCAGRNLFAEMVPNLTLAEISAKYDPRHINLSKGLLERVGVDSRIDKIWLSVAVQHPICFFNHKFQLTKFMVGANDGAQFLITHPAVDNNEYGYALPESSLRDKAVAYIAYASQLIFFKPWFLYLVAFVAFGYSIWIRDMTAGYVTLFASAAFYFAGLVLLGNAGDARLPFYTTTVLLMTTCISVIEFMKRGRAK